MSRELSKANPSNVELQIAVALALTGRADAYALAEPLRGVAPCAVTT